MLIYVSGGATLSTPRMKGELRQGEEAIRNKRPTQSRRRPSPKPPTRGHVKKGPIAV